MSSDTRYGGPGSEYRRKKAKELKKEVLETHKTLKDKFDKKVEYSELSNSELDRAIAERVMGYEIRDNPYPPTPFSSSEYSFRVGGGTWSNCCYLPKYSTDETTFFRDVAEKMTNDGWDIEVGVFMERGEYKRYCYLQHCGLDYSNRTYASSCARAGCEAALLALDEMEKRK